MARSPSPFGPSAWVAVGYAIWFWASVTWMMIEAPDWMLCYFMDSEQISVPFAHGLFLISLILSALSGHVLTAVQLQRGRTRLAIGTMLSGATLWIGLWVLTLDRYVAYGTTADWLAGSTEPINTSEVATAMNVVGVLTALGLAVPVIRLLSRNRRLRSL